MSKILEIKLKSKLKNMKKKEIKSFLINCIHKHKPNLLINSEYTNELDSDNDNDNYDDKMCQLCKNDVFEKTKYEEICQKCGLVRPIQATGKNYEKIPEYITLGKNIVKITDGGKNFSVDLNKLNSIKKMFIVGTMILLQQCCNTMQLLTLYKLQQCCNSGNATIIVKIMLSWE